MITILTLGGLILTFLIVLLLYTEKDAILALVDMLIGFIFLYILVSSVLFFFNKFSIVCTLLLELTILIVLVVVLWRRGKRPTISYDYRKTLVCIIICIVVFPFTAQKFGYFGMGQDEGIYQVKAITLIYGYNDNYFEFEEYDSLATDDEKRDYLTELENSQIGYYTANSSERIVGSVSSGYETATQGVLHGIPSYSAVLALMGSIFGIANMMHVGTIYYICGIFLIYRILKNWKVSNLLCALGSLCYAFSPIMIWVSKTALIETILSVIILAYIYLVSDEENKSLKWLSCIPILTFAVFHITIYVMMPMFIVIYFIYFMKTGRKKYLLWNIIILIGYYAGYLMMIHVAYVYSYMNYSALYHFGINTTNLTFVITVFVGALVAFHIVLGLLYNNAKNSYYRNIRKKIYKRCIKIMPLGVKALIALSIVLCLYRFLKNGLFINQMTLYAYMLCSGIVLLPVVLVCMYRKPKKIILKDRGMLITVMVCYCILIYAAVLKPITYYYYYYARYLIPYLSVIIIAACYLLGMVLKKRQIRNASIYIPIVIAVIVVLVYYPYNKILITQNDETSIEWDTMLEIADNFSENDAVIIEGEPSRILKIPLKVMKGVHVYPSTSNVSELASRLQEQYDTVYYISFNDEYNKYPDTMQCIQHVICDREDNTRNVVGYDTDGGIFDRYLGFSTAFVKIDNFMNVYQYCDSTE